MECPQHFEYLGQTVVPTGTEGVLGADPGAESRAVLSAPVCASGIGKVEQDEK